MSTRKNKTIKIPPALAEQGINLLELLIEAGGARRKRRTRRRKNPKRK